MKKHIQKERTTYLKNKNEKDTYTTTDINNERKLYRKKDIQIERKNIHDRKKGRLKERKADITKEELIQTNAQRK